MGGEQRDLFDRGLRPGSWTTSARPCVAAVVFADVPFGPSTTRCPTRCGGRPAGCPRRGAAGARQSSASRLLHGGRGSSSGRSALNRSRRGGCPVVALTSHAPADPVDCCTTCVRWARSWTRSCRPACAARRARATGLPARADEGRGTIARLRGQAGAGAQVLAMAPQGLTPAELAQAAGCAAGPIQELRSRNHCCGTSPRAVDRSAGYAAEPASSTLNADQQLALQAILESCASVATKRSSSTG